MTLAQLDRWRESQSGNSCRIPMPDTGCGVILPRHIFQMGIRFKGNIDTLIKTDSLFYPLFALLCSL